MELVENNMIFVFWATFDPPSTAHMACIRQFLHIYNPSLMYLVAPDSYAADKDMREMYEIFLKELGDTRISWLQGDPPKESLHIVEKGFHPDVTPFASMWIPSFENVHTTIVQYTGIEALYQQNPKFRIPGFSSKISQYILEKRLYRPKITKKPQLLVHICCGPDAILPIFQLRSEYQLLCFWYDPNIAPKSEYDLRFDAFKKVCLKENVAYIQGAYDVKNFYKRIRGLEKTPEKGEKCTHCYDMRLAVTARLAKRLGIKYFTSSLQNSPKKDLSRLYALGDIYAKKYDLCYLKIPFRQRGGFDFTVKYTHEHNIYRQNYCGCIYSLRTPGTDT